MRVEANVALKEWAAICTALSNGTQVLLIRKGGLREEGGVFRVEAEQFFLLPTFEHQKSELVMPQYQPLLDSIPVPPNDKVTLTGFGVAHTFYRAQNEEQVRALSAFHIGNENYVQQRFDYNPYDPLTLLVVRAYSLPRPIEMPYTKAFGGCRSWIDMGVNLTVEGAQPALPDDEFQRRCQAIDVVMRTTD